MSDLKRRVARIEQGAERLRVADAVRNLPTGAEAREQLLSSIESVAGWPAGTMPRTAQEASALGFDCVMGAVAYVMGVSIQEWLQILKSPVARAAYIERCQREAAKGGAND